MKDNHDRIRSLFRAARPARRIPPALALLAILILAGRPGAVQAEEPVPPRVLPETISAGGRHTCGLEADGSVACWGLDYHGQSTPPAHTPGDYLQASAGAWHTCGLKADGTVTCWGSDDDGEASPPAHGTGDYLQVSAGGAHTCGLKADGTVACWGLNGFDQATPPAHDPGDYLQVSAGGAHTCGLKADGSVACWGLNGNGQASPPAHDPGDYLQVSAGHAHTCGLKADGTVACWGSDGNGQSTPPAHDPGDYVQVSAGDYHTCGLKADGTVACWGWNDFDQATPPAHNPGDYLQVSAGGRHTCGLKADGSVACWGSDEDGQTTTPAHGPGDFGRSQISSGGYHTCGLKADGSVACWGENSLGQAPPSVGAAGDFVQVSAGRDHTCGLEADGTLTCWGRDDWDQATPPAHDPGAYLQASAGVYHTCGLEADGTVACWGDDFGGKTTPPAHDPGDYLQVNLGDYHSCGLKADGTVACWGWDDYGQSLPPAHDPGDYLQLSAGHGHTCGLRADGTVECWGLDNYGQASPPAHNPGDYLQVSAGGLHTCGLKADGTLACWGRDDYGQSSPPAHNPGDYLQVSAGDWHTCGLKTDGTLPCAPTGEAYHQALPSAGGGTPPYTYRAITALPLGLTLDATGVLSGTPTAAGFYTWTMQARDSSPLPLSAEQASSLTVGGPLVHADPAGLCDGSAPCFAALQDAAACVQFGGTVDAHDGSYAEAVTVTRSLTLTGAPILNGPLTLGHGLAAYWPLDAGNGLTAHDASGRGHNGTLINGPAWTATAAPLAFGSPYALAFDGQDDYVLVPDHPNLNFDAEPAFTLAAWVQTERTSQQEDGAAIIAKGKGDGEEQYALDVYLGAFRFFVRDSAGSGAYDVGATGVFTASAGWTHVAATLDAEQDLMALYVDGVEQARRLPPASLYANTHPLSIGSRQNGSGNYDYNFQGRIDDVRLYGRALSAPEIAALAAGGHNNTLVLGSDLDLNGDLTLNAATLDAGPGGQALDLGGDWTSHGGAFAAQAGTVRFDGAGVQTIAGDVAFHDLTVGQGVSLTTASEVTVGGILSNLGWTVESKAIAGAGARAFGLAGVTVDVTTPGSLSGLVVARRDTDHPHAPPAARTGRYWRITPAGGGYTATLTLPHDGLADPYACKYLGSGWDWGRDAFDAASVTRSGITAFSEWAVSDGPPVYRLYLPMVLKAWQP